MNFFKQMLLKFPKRIISFIGDFCDSEDYFKLSMSHKNEIFNEYLYYTMINNNLLISTNFLLLNDVFEFKGEKHFSYLFEYVSKYDNMAIAGGYTTTMLFEIDQFDSSDIDIYIFGTQNEKIIQTYNDLIKFLNYPKIYYVGSCVRQIELSVPDEEYSIKETKSLNNSVDSDILNPNTQNDGIKKRNLQIIGVIASSLTNVVASFDASHNRTAYYLGKTYVTPDALHSKEYKKTFFIRRIKTSRALKALKYNLQIVNKIDYSLLENVKIEDKKYREITNDDEFKPNQNWISMYSPNGLDNQYCDTTSYDLLNDKYDLGIMKGNVGVYREYMRFKVLLSKGVLYYKINSPDELDKKEASDKKEADKKEQTSKKDEPNGENDFLDHKKYEPEIIRHEHNSIIYQLVIKKPNDVKKLKEIKRKLCDIFSTIQEVPKYFKYLKQLSFLHDDIGKYYNELKKLKKPQDEYIPSYIDHISFSGDYAYITFENKDTTIEKSIDLTKEITIDIHLRVIGDKFSHDQAGEKYKLSGKYGHVRHYIR